MRGLLGYGLYDDDPDRVGCPRAQTDMTPCVARDEYAVANDGRCIGCGERAEVLLRALVREVLMLKPAVFREKQGDEQ